jgi:transposase
MGDKYYKFIEIEVSPKLMRKLLEHTKDPKVTQEHINYILDNLLWLSKHDECLTLDEFEVITEKPIVS